MTFIVYRGDYGIRLMSYVAVIYDIDVKLCCKTLLITNNKCKPSQQSLMKSRLEDWNNFSVLFYPGSLKRGSF